MKPYLLIFIFFITCTCTSKEKLAILHGPLLQHLQDSGATIVWTTNQNAFSWVEVTYADSSLLHSNVNRKYYSKAYELKEPAKVHSVRINHLKPDISYTYSIHSQLNTNNHRNNKTVSVSACHKDKPLKFRTNPSTENDISLIAVNDIHGHSGQLRNLLKQADYPSADLIIFNGDMVSDMKNEKQYFNDFMNTAIKMFAHEKPIVYARGNHETEGNHADAFSGYFKTHDGNLYYLLRRGPVCFVILDSGVYNDYSETPHIVEKEFDQYRDRECEWLSEAIKTKEFTEASFRVAIIHVPPIGLWHGAVEVASKFVPILNEANTDVMICGHLHRYYHQKVVNGINFPVVVNSNNTVIRAEADAKALSLKIIDRRGKQVDLIEVKK